MNKRLLKVAKYLLENGFENEAAKIKKLAGITESEEEYSNELKWLQDNLFVKNDELDDEYAMKKECERMGLKGFYNSNNGIPAILSARLGYWVYKPRDRMYWDDMDYYDQLMEEIGTQGYRENGGLPVRSEAGRKGRMADLGYLHESST